jgi:hypothetical protein
MTIPTPKTSRLKRSLIPSLASVAIHTALALALLGITIDRFTAPPPRPARLALEPTAVAPPPLPNQRDDDPPEPHNEPPASTPSPSNQQRIEQTTLSKERTVNEAAQRLATRAARPSPIPPRPSRPAPTIERTPPPPAVTFAGTQATAATRVVFAVDASGAMVTSFSFIQDELARAINRLQPTQSFQIVLFGERTTDTGKPSPHRTIPHTGDDNDLIRASAGNRILAQRWINAALPGGKSNPVEGLTRALEFDPDLIFLLARGIQRTGALPDPADQQAILAQLDAQNPTDPRTGLRPTVIKAIEFVEPDPTGLIEQIARTHGDGEGSLRLITPENTADPNPVVENETPTTNTNLDTATSLLASLAADATDTAVLARVATEAESARAQAAAERALASLADLPPPTRRTTDPRPHLLRARAALLLATTETHPPKRTDLAMQALADLTPLRIADPATAAERDILTARANLILDRPELAHADLLALLRTADPTDPNLTTTRAAALETALARARLTILDAAAALGPSTPEAARARDAATTELAAAQTNRTIPDPTLHALLAAALVRANLSASVPDPFDPLTDLYTTSALTQDTRRALAAPRLDAIVRTSNTPLDQLPLAAIRALADHATWDPHTNADQHRAADLHARLAELSTDPAERAAALLAAAHHARTAGDPTRARTLAFRFAETYPDHPDAAAALTLAVGADPEITILERALAINPAHSLADTWRLDLARLTRGPAALDLLAAITPPNQTSAALALELIDEQLPAATDAERTTLLARAAAEARVLAGDLDPSRRLLLARSLATTDPARAERTLADLPPNLTTSADADRVRLTIAETRAADPETYPDGEASAFTTARAIAEQRTASGPDADLYWHAVTLWLELGARNGGPDAKAAARAHIAGLRQSHPDLGGDPWRTRLNAIAE